MSSAGTLQIAVCAGALPESLLPPPAAPLGIADGLLQVFEGGCQASTASVHAHAPPPPFSHYISPGSYGKMMPQHQNLHLQLQQQHVQAGAAAACELYSSTATFVHVPGTTPPPDLGAHTHMYGSMAIAGWNTALQNWTLYSGGGATRAEHPQQAVQPLPGGQQAQEHSHHAQQQHVQQLYTSTATQQQWNEQHAQRQHTHNEEQHLHTHVQRQNTQHEVQHPHTQQNTPPVSGPHSATHSATHAMSHAMPTLETNPYTSHCMSFYFGQGPVAGRLMNQAVPPSYASTPPLARLLHASYTPEQQPHQSLSGLLPSYASTASYASAQAAPCAFAYEQQHQQNHCFPHSSPR